MKKLYLIRHAKSSWKDSSLEDFDRPLNKRGRLNAPFMGETLKSKNVKPDLILSSPALRAKTTARVIAKEVGYFKKIVFKEEMYEASVGALHEIVTQVGDEVHSLFLFGHNPSLNELAQKYVGFEDNVPTCGVLEIEFDCDSWSQIDRENSKIVSLAYPKKHL